jgi:hypothetical protein
MSDRNPAAPVLLTAAKRLRQRAAELAKTKSVGGAGKIWRDPRALQEYEETRHLAQELKRISAALGRMAIVSGHGGRPELERA